MTWWRWGLVGLVAAAVVAGLGYLVGVTVERDRATQSRLELLSNQIRADIEHAATTARLQETVVARETALQAALARVRASEAREAAAEQATTATRAQLAQAMTAADSLAAYVPLVAGLTEELAIAKSSTRSYREALAASIAKSAALTARVAADSLLIEGQRETIRGMSRPTTAGSGRLGRVVETAALAAATAGACQRGVLTVGCLAGAAATWQRLR